MEVCTSLPEGRSEGLDEFLSLEGIREIAIAAEHGGFDVIRVAEHPFPDENWLQYGSGHHDLDPFVALSFAAAATSKIKLQTYLLILPYRNPFLSARAAASLDLLSGGRLLLGCGAGYLEAEFKALGVAFGDRNALFDEAITAMRRAWTESNVHMKGRYFEAQGHTMLPRPAQPGGPPIWVGGNSKRAIRRAVELGDGWLPMAYTGNQVVSRHTAILGSIDDLKASLTYAAEYASEIGRKTPLAVSFPLQLSFTAGATEDLFKAAHALAEIGITQVALSPPRSNRAEYIDGIARLSEEVLPQLHAIEAKTFL
jgi:probable F420-dependent oxidoreductase